MSKDYKAIPAKAAAARPAPATTTKQKPAGKGSPLIIGLLIGLLIGIAMSLGVAFFVKSGGSSFQEKTQPAASLPISAPEKKPEAPMVATPSNSGQISSETVEPAKKTTDSEKKEDRFTFYGILTEATPPAPNAEPKQPDAVVPTAPNASTASSTPTPTGERYYLQVGAFQTEKEADNIKAKLSLMGMEAIVQTANIPDKGILHRVRVGPIAGSDDLGRIKAELLRNGFSAEPVKIQN